MADYYTRLHYHKGITVDSIFLIHPTAIHFSPLHWYHPGLNHLYLTFSYVSYFYSCTSQSRSNPKKSLQKITKMSIISGVVRGKRQVRPGHSIDQTCKSFPFSLLVRIRQGPAQSTLLCSSLLTLLTSTVGFL